MNIGDKTGSTASCGARSAGWPSTTCSPEAGRRRTIRSPWASRPELSFLVTEDELRALLAEAGFRPTSARDVTEPGLTWTRRFPLGPAFDNLARALEDGRLRLLQLVAA